MSQRVGFVAIMMLVCILLNLVYLYICLEGYIVSVEDLKSYFLVNFLVIAILCAGAITMAVLNVEPLYTFLFFPFKFFNAVFRMSKTASAIISSVFLFVYVAVAPIISARKVMSYD
ncbi:MAG: hypothetical protein IKU61_04760 [Clostridia bacterium]|nr:hypothetical protein [Clostridia bacterium]